jgi:integrase
MATTLRIDTVSARTKLKPRREAYWQRVRVGIYLGYRKLANNSEGTWLVRVRTPENRQRWHPLGTFDEEPAHCRFDRAMEAAVAWIDALDASPPMNRQLTVLDACQAYERKVRDDKGNDKANELAARYRRWVAPDPIATILLSELTSNDTKAFKRRLVEAPVKGKAGTLKRRSLDTVNRDLAPVRAALNQAVQDGLIGNNRAWLIPLRAFKNVSRRRDLYLDIDQRRSLVDKAQPDFANFAAGLSMLPARPGALAHLKVVNFESRLDVLTMGKDKSGQDRKIKLPPAIANFLRKVAGSRPANEPLFVRECGLAWDKDGWKYPLKRAAAAAGLPLKTVAYTLRHSAITDMVHSGIDLLTVAQLSGTSVQMIEKNYGHLRPHIAAQALSTLIL